MNARHLFLMYQPDPPDPDGNYTDSDPTGDDESATCPEDFGS